MRSSSSTVTVAVLALAVVILTSGGVVGVAARLVVGLGQQAPSRAPPCRGLRCVHRRGLRRGLHRVAGASEVSMRWRAPGVGSAVGEVSRRAPSGREGKQGERHWWDQRKAKVILRNCAMKLCAERPVLCQVSRLGNWEVKPSIKASLSVMKHIGFLADSLSNNTRRLIFLTLSSPPPCILVWSKRLK